MAKHQGAQDQANARFKKAEMQARGGDGAHALNAARSRAVDANTAMLKGLRLEKERVQREAAAEAAPTVVKKARSTKKPDPGS